MAEDKHIEGMQLQGRLQRLVGQWAKGQVTLKEMLGLTEDELFSIANQAYLFFLQGKTESARVLFEGLVAVNPRNAYYYRALGAIYWRLKEPQKALRQFTYAIRVAPKDVASYVNRAEVYIAGRQFEEAREDLSAGLRNAGPLDEALMRKARAMLKMIR
ncbi:MAG: tetratricopeptide repeat protein [Myxococcota bacterium]